jgi:hypothetical protein
MSAHSNPLDLVLTDANHLLAYAVEAGIDVEPEITDRILEADKKGEPYWSGSEPSALLSAVTRLAAKLHPVTAETLRACREEARSVIRRYEICVIVLAAIILPISIFSAVYTGISNAINAQIKEANETVLQLHSSLSTSADKISALQQLAINTRAIPSRATQLNLFNIAGMKKSDMPPADIELPPDLNSKNEAQIDQQITDMTETYQKVRAYAKNILDATSIWFGAVSTAILPILYAILGAFASVLRAFTQQLEKRTFNYSYSSPARFIIAAIGGGVIGLFNFSIGEGLTVSPLALAFVVGYSTDVFFSFLEGSVPNAAKGAPSPPNLPPHQK